MTAERRLALLISANDDANTDAPRFRRPTPGLSCVSPEEDAYYLVWYEVCYRIASQARLVRRRAKRLGNGRSA